MFHACSYQELAAGNFLRLFLGLYNYAYTFLRCIGMGYSDVLDLECLDNFENRSKSSQNFAPNSLLWL
jgi:hypothetical protein